MTNQLTDANRDYYTRRYAEEIARSVDAADMTAAMPHRRLASLYAALLRNDAEPELRTVADDSSLRARPFILGGHDEI